MLVRSTSTRCLGAELLVRDVRALLCEPHPEPGGWQVLWVALRVPFALPWWTCTESEL